MQLKGRTDPGPGQESVGDYPRPPRLEQARRHVRVEHQGLVVADTRNAWRVLETSHPPVYYIPPDDVDLSLMHPAGRRTFCEWKGYAVYHDLAVGESLVEAAAWSYPDPTAAFVPIRDHLAFYASRVDLCSVDGEVATAQRGDFYGGWITSDIVGPFKGGPGSSFW